MEPSDPHRVPYYIAASTLVLTAVIVFAARLRGGRPLGWAPIFVVAGLVSLVGVLFAKYGANFGLPWWIYYTIPMLATVVLPPLVFRFGGARTATYLVLAFLSAPLIHALFFYGLGWGDYMPFVHLPRL